MSCRCDSPGWLEGHDEGCPYDGDKTPWFEEALARIKEENTFLRGEVNQRVDERDTISARYEQLRAAFDKAAIGSATQQTNATTALRETQSQLAEADREVAALREGIEGVIQSGKHDGQWTWRDDLRKLLASVQPGRDEKLEAEIQSQTKTMEELNAEVIAALGIDEYTREQFEADRARLLTAIAAKHGIAESEVDVLIKEHRYEHSAEDLEDEYIQAMAMARGAGWLEGASAPCRCGHPERTMIVHTKQGCTLDEHAG